MIMVGNYKYLGHQSGVDRDIVLGEAKVSLQELQNATESVNMNFPDTKMVTYHSA